jgi:hypothetical protein
MTALGGNQSFTQPDWQVVRIDGHTGGKGSDA